MKKRLLAILLTVCMVLSMAPAALAAETATTYAEKLEELGYTFTLSGVHITEAGYYKLDGTKVDSADDAQVQVTDPVNKKMTYLNGTTWQDVSRVYATEHTAWEKEAIGVYVAGEHITESGTYHDGAVLVDLENKKITLNNATITHTTGEMTLLENIVDPDYTGASYQGKSLYDNITGVPGVLVITEGTYNTPGSGAGAGNWDCYYYWPIGYETSYRFGSIALGIMADDESGAAYEDWTIELQGTNKITVNSTFGMPQQIGYLLDAPAYGIFAESNLTITGTGSLETVVNNEWNILEAGYKNYGNPSTAGAIWARGDLEITGGTITASTSTMEVEADYTATFVNTAAAIGATGSVTITGEDTTVSATDTTNQGIAIRGTTGVTITDSATVTANSSSDIAGAAIMAGASQWSGAALEISGGANVTATAASTSDNELLTSGVGIVGGAVSISESTVNVETQVTGITAGVLNVESGEVAVTVSNENGTAIEADSGSIAVGSYNTPVDSDLIADGSVVADGAVMPKEELGAYTARIENTYYTGEDGGNKAIADLTNKQTVWLNADTSASRNDFALGNTITIMLAEGVEYTGTISGPSLKADIVEGVQEELDDVLYTEYIYTLVVDPDNAAAKVIHADGTETYYSAVFGTNGPIYVLNKLEDGDTIVVLQDAVCDYYAGYDIEKDVTLDLNGKTLTFEDSGGLNVEGKANDPVVVTIIDSSTEKNGKIVNTYTTSSNYVGSTVVVRPYAEVAIEAGSYDGKTQAAGGKLTLAGGTYLREVVAGTYSNTIGTVIVTEDADITGCTAYADGGILLLPNQNIGGDISNTAGTDNVKWKLVDAEGNDADLADVEAGNCKLVIYGTGAMKSFNREDAPWIGYNGIVSEIIIEDGVTNISDSALVNMNGYDLTLGNSITSINTFAMDYTVTSLGVVTIPAGMTANLNSILNGYSNGYRTVEGFVVAEENAVYSTDGKGLYYSGEEEGKKLMKAAALIDGSYVIDDAIVDIKANAFNNVVFESVTIPSSFDNVYTFRKLTAVPEGLVFGGYYTSKDPTVVEELRIDTTGDENKEAFTVYMVLGYEVTYNFGSGEKTVVVPTGKTIGEFAPAVTVDGKELVGWSTTENGTEDDASSVKPTAVMTVYAVWETDETFTPEYEGITLETIPAYTYTGEVIKPAVYYKDAEGNLKQVAENCVVYTNNTNAGTATVEVVVDGNTVATTTFTINKAKFNAGNYSWQGATNVTYDGQMHSLTIKEELPNGVTVTYTYDGESVEGVKDVNYYTPGDPSSGVRSYPVKATFTLDDNLEFEKNLNSYKTKTAYLYIYPREATVTVNSATMYVGEDLPEFTYTVSGLEEGMNLTNEPTITTSASGNKAGNFPITASGAVVNNDANNYKITYVSGYLTVGMKILDAGVSFANSTVTYDGEEHNIAITVDGTLPESFSVAYTVNGEPFTGATNAGTYEVTATITSTDPAYEAIEPLTATLEIKPATVTITADDVSIYVRGTIPALTYTVEGLLGGDELTAEPTLTCDADVNSVGAYDIVPSGGEVGSNYVLEYVNGTLTVRARPIYSGDTYSVTTEKTENGSVKVSPSNATLGSTVTITVEPDAGYKLGDLTVLDKNGKEIELTAQGNGKYTFKMPSGKVTVEATFVEAVTENPFVDVAENAYYYDAVLWAVENEITTGTGADTFSPNAVCTRAQVVTFLWRAAGCPEPVGAANAFDDVASNAYYAKAVQWAVEQGITLGTGDGKFSPDAECTRGQIVTFLWRSQGSENATANNPFVDVADGTYYEDAVLWAVEEAITNGTSADTFSPDADCTRGQIVTFLYRCLAE